MPFFQGLRERGQNLTVALGSLLSLLKIVQPKRGVDADEHEHKFGEPASEFSKRPL